MTEFDIIKHYFARNVSPRSDVIIGIGDDGAIVKPPQDHELVITSDTLIAGIHFPLSTSPFDIGHKSLAVNLSDLAAMGATPAWVTLALTLPQEDKTWLSDFCQGFFTLAKQHQVQLIGGDLTHGPLSITITAMGFVPAQSAILRSQAKPGDLIYVTGTLGDAGHALHLIQNNIPADANHESVLARLNRPEPRVTCGEQLRGLAHAAIDISDGLAADLSHILEQSHVGATIYVDQLPLSETLQLMNPLKAIELALTAGDDYELCFTIPAAKQDELSALSCPVTCIGEITALTGLNLRYKNGSNYHGSTEGYQHF